MLSNLPVGKSVILTITGTGKDANGVPQPAPITNIQVAPSEASLQVSTNPDGTLTLKSVADKGAGNLNVTALNSAGTLLSASDAYTTGSAAPPIVADTLAFSYGAPF